MTEKDKNLVGVSLDDWLKDLHEDPDKNVVVVRGDGAEVRLSKPFDTPYAEYVGCDSYEIQCKPGERYVVTLEAVLGYMDYLDAETRVGSVLGFGVYLSTMRRRKGDRRWGAAE